MTARFRTWMTSAGSRLKPHAFSCGVSLVLHASLAGALVFADITPPASEPPQEAVAVVLVAGGGGGGGGPRVEPVETATVEEAPKAPPPRPRKKPSRPRPKPPVEKAEAIPDPSIPAIPEAPKAPEPETEPEIESEPESVLAENEVDNAEDDSNADEDAETSDQVLLASNLTATGGSGSGDGSGEPGEGSGGDGPPYGSPFGSVDGDAIDVKRAATAPRVLRRTAPEYPRRARSAGTEGLVVVRAIVGKDGRIESQNLRVLRSVPSLDEAAVEAVRTWRFSPALDGMNRPIRVIVTIPVRFSLR